MKRFKETVIEVIEVSDIDMMYPFYSGDDRNEVETPKNIWSDTESMNIDDAIEILTKLKKLGSNRIYIVSDADHHSYIFTGVNCKEKNI